jgi:2-phospho-L-lactate guanylyltransferase
MLDDVLAACAAAPLDGTIAVVNTEIGLKAASARGAHTLLDPGADMNAAVATGVSAAMARGACAVLVVPGDLPLATPDDLAAVLSHGRTSSSVVLARDHTGTGTNALLLRPPDAIAPAFGVDSATRHVAAASGAGMSTVALDLPRLAADVDTRADLERVAAAAPGPSTAALLASLHTLVR